MKVAVITGAASGIGLALSHICLQRGIKVVMVDKDGSRLIKEANTLIALFPGSVLNKTCDITKPDEIVQLLHYVDTHCGRIDWLFNNAGIMGTLAPVWELQPEQLNQVMDVNLYGMTHVIRIFMPYLFKQQFHSHIINMGSMYGLCSGSQIAAYSMSKHAVLALSESLFYDLKRLEKPVDVSVVFPSFTDTALLSNNSAESQSAFHESLNSLLAHSRPASDVALHIIQEVELKRFYILPDKEVKGYCEERTNAILRQENPYINNIEKLMNSLIKRKRVLV
ncbi:SDR family NAD(P)-dependent oxidoreductase [Legionella bononiensis]|uniref:SDR family NAD(P)-dependent oxidoreductase n=1 Tax=Legionella bononiensis TaxID=2793102 RepID=A0ABS1W861_9GAMM|nr:SDR family NAD(P)-dependent oxidoreductase [Legionella bononiensis]MBL7479948.1 SDR family NAD(P)-dependent oxidoreductase [Legionella bononiensis]MBL7525537.1 SDR family NAD(P)-dependent oxidoreductase [Legionella bononiensis]MBL7561721.1 SDR family NAD(P)-dependent oxidoreductase [Legionella bononiensis]